MSKTGDYFVSYNYNYISFERKIRPSSHIYSEQKESIEELFLVDHSSATHSYFILSIYLRTYHPETQISLKCDPERAITLREEYQAIVPAWHFNKKHWNTVKIDHSISGILLCELINHSYNLVVAGLPKKLREELE